MCGWFPYLNQLIEMTNRTLIFASLIISSLVLSPNADAGIKSFLGKFKKNKTEKVVETSAKEESKPETIIIDSNDEIPNLEEKLYGEWNLLSINGKKLITRDRAYINFNFADHHFYGSNGCNVVNGSFTIKGNTISLDDIISTMMECHAATSESTIMKALNDVNSFAFTTQNGMEYLNLMNIKGHVMVSLKRQNMDFLNGAWKITSLSNENTEGNDLRLVIDMQEMLIHGDSGCNVINGKLSIDPYKDFAVQFEQLSSTRKACPNSATELAMLAALEEVVTARKISNSEIHLLNNKAQVIITLTPISLK